MKPRRYAPRQTGHVKTLSKYDKIAVQKRYGCIRNGKIIKKKRVIKKVKCKARRQAGFSNPGKIIHKKIILWKRRNN